MAIHKKLVSSTILGAVVLSVPLMAPVTLQAQGVLEEIIVTAQRREQSLQEVPISIETVSGEEINRQGYRDMQELVNFSPTVTVEPDILRSSITIRGFGAASADALTIEQSSPTFIDGIHYGRTSQVKVAFMDLQSVEVLKGPQPVYFGQNAIAGAFNLTTRKPTPEWEGIANLEYSDDNTQKAEFGVGGPITETLGIRVAGSFQRSDGYLVDVVTNDKFPHYKNYGGRVILHWTPTDNFQATVKFETSDQNKGAQGNHVCLRENGEYDFFSPDAVLVDPPIGAGWNIEHRPLGECYASNDGIIPQGQFPPPTPSDPFFVLERGNTILVNVNSVAPAIPRPSSADGFREDRDPYSFESRENIEPWNTYLNLTYTLDNGIEFNSLTGYDYYYREYLRDNRGTPIFANFQNREEDQYSISQELRVTSPTGGMFEWMIGAYYQQVDYDIFSDSIRPNTRAARRYNEGWEDAEWKSVFGNLTYNFLDGRASIDLGARYSNSWKNTFIQGWTANWIQSDGTVIPWNTRINPTTNAALMIYQGDIVIGMTDLVKNDRVPGPHLGEADQTELNPQIVLRYRPNDDISLYAKYAESFKTAGFNTGQASIPDFETYGFGPEYSHNYEVGAKGNFLGGQARYNVTVFYQKTTDLQLAAARGDFTELSNTQGLLTFQNAGAQRTRGVEISMDWLVTDRLSLSLSGAILDGVMLDYQGASCNSAEFEFPDVSGCDITKTPPEIDRSGSQAPNTPDYKFVLNADYRWPLANGYEVGLNAKGYISDGYITDTNGFSQVTKMNQHGDLSASAGIGPQSGSWKVSIFARNILGVHQSYNPEFQIGPPSPVSSPTMYRTSFMSYGMGFRYNYN